MATTTATAPRPTTFLAELDGAPVLGHVPPNWFAAVMGTAIVAIALVGLPVEAVADAAAVRVVATGFWLLASALLLLVGTATLLHHRRHPAAARAHRTDAVTVNFYGAPAMALMAVGAATVVVGSPVLGRPGALVVDAVLWAVGTAIGLVTLVAVPRRLVALAARGELGPAEPFGGWLMPVVPPMVTATTGALLVPHVATGRPQQALLLFCYLCAAVSLVASAVVAGLVLRRLRVHGVGAAAAVPTLWIGLGPMGQSVTAVQHLGVLAPGVLPGGVGRGLAGLTLGFGLPMGALALAWLVTAATVTARTVVEGLPFSLSWWSFTFPVGTVVTGASALALATGSTALGALALVLCVGLVGAWTTVAARTVRGVWSGRLLRP